MQVLACVLVTVALAVNGQNGEITTWSVAIQPLNSVAAQRLHTIV